jgi:hypothetical protein
MPTTERFRPPALDPLVFAVLLLLCALFAHP